MNYIVKTGFSNMQIDDIYRLLHTSYWAQDRSREAMIKSMENSLCFGVFDGEKQIAFARVFSDYVTTYYLCDIIVDSGYRGQGIGKQLVGYIVEYPDLQSLKGVLGTKDAHDLYRQFGFQSADENMMIRKR